MFFIYLVEFIVFSFFGWIIDSVYRSFVDKKIINAGYFRGPVCPIYGFGGLALVFTAKFLVFCSFLTKIMVGFLLILLIEYLGSIFSEKVLKIKLWDYSKAILNLNGRIDIYHSFYWLILVILFYYFVFPLVVGVESLF